MKVLGVFLIIAFISLLAMKMTKYFRYIKLHHKHIAQMEELTIELRAKQKILNQRAKVLQGSEKFQKDNLNTIHANIYKVIDKLLSSNE